jgi:hypothetical protein
LSIKVSVKRKKNDFTAIKVLAGAFMSLFQPTFLFNSIFDNDSSDGVLRWLKLSTNIHRKIDLKKVRIGPLFPILTKTDN